MDTQNYERTNTNPRSRPAGGGKRKREAALLGIATTHLSEVSASLQVPIHRWIKNSATIGDDAGKLGSCCPRAQFPAEDRKPRGSESERDAGRFLRQL